MSKPESYLDSKWTYTTKMFCIPIDELDEKDCEVVSTKLMAKTGDTLILSTLDEPGCIIYVESPYDNPVSLEDLDSNWDDFSLKFRELVLHCQQNDYMWLRLAP